MKLPCVTIRQPFAAAILDGLKNTEYRTRRTKHRGPLAVHAALGLSAPGVKEFAENYGDGKALVKGAIVGVVEVTDCVELEPGYFAWELANPVRFAEPIPMKGRLGVFHVEIPDALLPAAVAAG